MTGYMMDSMVSLKDERGNMAACLVVTVALPCNYRQQEEPILVLRPIATVYHPNLYAVSLINPT